MRPTLAILYGGGLAVALFVAQTQLDGDARFASMGGVLLAMALLFKWQIQRMIRQDEALTRSLMRCDDCGHTRGEHWGIRCPGGDIGDTFTRAHYGLAR